ncbi:hypothetical protein LTR36_009457 [Oleoguttula mirabilis]|uniref:non-specific serine/threonine protein kinase n=1 Tax=Oleoguttula mirabilis TaxID=1507867 RepID=A0AAV9JSE3_9PEZI|nr:hypothetical protein LTR36_009457 [Oleoguttula mirabilis]
MFDFLPKLKTLLRFSQTNSSNKPDNDRIQTNMPQSAAEHRSQDRYQHIHHLANSTEGELGIVRSDRTGKLLVAKHTKARQVIRLGDGPIFTYPNEAKILLKTLGGADHPNIIHLFGAERSCIEPGRHFLLLEYCSGGDLLDQIGQFTKMGKAAYGASRHLLLRKVLPADTLAHPPKFAGNCLVPEMFVLHVFVGLVWALAFLHDASEHEAVIHGDLKPDNVLLRWSSRNECGMPDIVLADFGASQLASKTIGVTGTPGYDSPEVVGIAQLKTTAPQAFEWKRKQRVMSTKSDIYQLGHLMYLLTTMQLWTTGADPEALTLPQEYTTQHCRHLATTVAWCFAVRPTKRPSATEDLLTVIDTFREQRDGLFRERGPLPQACWRKAVV